MVKLQRPAFVFMNGKLTPWDDARVHVGAPALTRGISVLEGIKGYWRHDGSHLALLAMRPHFERLQRSAMLQHLPFSMSYEEFTDACFAIVRELLSEDRDLWIRPTLFALEGHWGLDTVTDLVITCYNQVKKAPDPISLGISTWQRPLDAALPYRIKSAANYQMGRLARIEGRRQGFNDMVMLNQQGRVAEATASCVLVVRDGSVVTPPPSEGCLESITVNIIESLCESLGIPFDRRPIDRTELRIADELALVGTLAEVAIVQRFEDREMPEARVLSRLRDEYFACARGLKTNPIMSLTPV
jgi:branched-chain amino acid aminotransferase